jgi:Family of unknown function (DUF6279)
MLPRMGMTITARVAVFVAVAALLVSCSFTKLAYNQADTAAAWMADDYFDLTGPQKTDLQERFARFHAWHRAEQLPEYARFMRTARSKVQDGLAPDEVLWFVDGIRTRYRAMAVRAAPDAAALLATLTPAQIENLQRKWEKDNRKYVKEHKLNGTPEERHEYEAKRTAKHFREWLAPLNSEQEQRVLAAVRQMPDLSRERYEERLRRQKAFLEVLAHRDDDRQRFQARLTEWLTAWDRTRSPEYQKRLDAVWQQRAELFSSLERTFTAEQRNNSLQKMASYADDFTQLASRTGEAARTAAAR